MLIFNCKQKNNVLCIELIYTLLSVDYNCTDIYYYVYSFNVKGPVFSRHEIFAIKHIFSKRTSHAQAP